MRRGAGFMAVLLCLSVGIAAAQTVRGDDRQQALTPQSRTPAAPQESSDPQEGGEITRSPAPAPGRRHIGTSKYGAVTAPSPPTSARDPRAVGAVIAATNSIKCGDTIYQVSVDGGRCRKEGDSFVLCSNEAGDGAAASCSGGCGGTNGSGSCTIQGAPN